MEKEEFVELEIHPACINDPSGQVWIRKEKFEKLCEKYGMYGIDWYYVSENSIKYYTEDQGWRWTRETVDRYELYTTDGRTIRGGDWDEKSV